MNDMKRISALIASAIMLASCMINFGGTTVTGYTEEGCDFSEVRQMPMFDAINVAGPVNVYYVQSNESKVLVEGKEEFVGKVITEIKDEDLDIDLEPGTYRNLVLKITVYAPIVDEFRVSGSGNLSDISGHTSKDDIEYKTSGSGDLILAGISTSDDIEIQSTGSGDVYAENISCKGLSAKFSGSGDMKMTGAVVKNDAEISVSGSGDVRMDAEIGNDLEARINGSGDMKLNGSCNKADLKITGSGDMSGNLNYKKITTSCSGSGRINL